MVVATLNAWAEGGVDLEHALPALKTLETASDPAFAELCLMTAEHALVDGLFDFVPAIAPLMPVRSVSLATDLDEIRRMMAELTSHDPVLRARIDCLVADASLPLSQGQRSVETAYSSSQTWHCGRDTFKLMGWPSHGAATLTPTEVNSTTLEHGGRAQSGTAREADHHGS